VALLRGLRSTVGADLGGVDPLTFVAVIAVILLVGVAASILPARRASLVDPMITLRCE